jgi:hypothetical protein
VANCTVQRIKFDAIQILTDGFLKKTFFGNWLKMLLFLWRAHLCRKSFQKVLLRPQTFYSSRINYLGNRKRIFVPLFPNRWHDYQKMLLKKSYSKNLEKDV